MQLKTIFVECIHVFKDSATLPATERLTSRGLNFSSNSLLATPPNQSHRGRGKKPRSINTIAGAIIQAGANEEDTFRFKKKKREGKF